MLLVSILSWGICYSTITIFYISLMRGIIMCRSLSLWWISLIMIPSKSLHVAAKCMTLSFLMAEYYPVVCMYHSFSIQSSSFGRLFPDFGYCGQCCKEHKCANVFSTLYFCVLEVYSKKQSRWIKEKFNSVCVGSLVLWHRGARGQPWLDHV